MRRSSRVTAYGYPTIAYPSTTNPYQTPSTIANPYQPGAVGVPPTAATLTVPPPTVPLQRTGSDPYAQYAPAPYTPTVPSVVSDWTPPVVVESNDDASHVIEEVDGKKWFRR